MLGLNFLTPLCFGDDYVYAFIWPGQSMYVPLPETVQRVSSFHDILISQWSHYCTGNGRMIAHMLVQFFVWQGKMIFNFANAVVFVLLILEIFWISNRGVVTFKRVSAESLVWIFFVLWMFTVNFGGVYLWLSGACNYLWMTVLLLSFVVLYVRKYFWMETKLFESEFVKYPVFVWGVIAGWTNENTVCWFILFLALWLFLNRNQKGMEAWMWFGLFGLCTGYALLILAPGNALRAGYYAEHSINLWVWGRMQQKLITFILIEFLEIFLWFYILSSFKKVSKETTDVNVSRQVALSKAFCIISLLSNATMLLAPEFPSRSGFPSLVFLTISAALMIHLQPFIGKSFTDEYAKKFLTFIGTCCFLITLCATYLGFHATYEYDKNLKETVRLNKASGVPLILEVLPPPEHPDKLVWASCQHLIHPELTEDADHWMNVAFARYFGIKGIRMVRETEKSQ